MRRFRRPPAIPSLAVAAVLVATSTAGCISGRVLEGYPGYPFVSFDIPSPPDSAFFAVQRELSAEGFEVDFTDQESGFVHTRPAPRASGSLRLSVVLGEAGGGSRVWIAGYEPVRDGARRIDPLDEDGWSDLVAVADAMSARLGGTAPVGPDDG